MSGNNFRRTAYFLIFFVIVFAIASIFTLSAKDFKNSYLSALNNYLSGVVPISSCTNNSDCGYGQICKNGLCAGGSLAIYSGSNGDSPGIIPCSSNEECPNGKICHNGFCYITAGSSCKTDSECPALTACCDNACQEASICAKTQCSDPKKIICITEQNHWGTCQNGACKPNPPTGGSRCAKITCDVCNKCDEKTGKCAADPVACDEKNPGICTINKSLGYCVNVSGIGVCKPACKTPEGIYGTPDKPKDKDGKVITCAADNSGNGVSPNFIVKGLSKSKNCELALYAEYIRAKQMYDWTGKIDLWQVKIEINITEINDYLTIRGDLVAIQHSDGEFYPHIVIRALKGSEYKDELGNNVTQAVLEAYFSMNEGIRLYNFVLENGTYVAKRNQPLWLIKGMSYMSTDDCVVNRYKKNLADWYKENGVIPAKDLFSLTTAPQSGGTPYYQAWSMVNFLISKGVGDKCTDDCKIREGKQKFTNFFAEGVKNRNWDAAVKKYYEYNSLAEMEADWKKSENLNCEACPTPPPPAKDTCPVPEKFQPGKPSVSGLTIEEKIKVVTVRMHIASSGWISGTVIRVKDKNGVEAAVVLTCGHAFVSTGSDPKITLDLLDTNGNILTSGISATLLGFDDRRDVAIVKINKTGNIPTTRLGTTPVARGEQVITSGCSHGADTCTLQKGTVNWGSNSYQSTTITCISIPGRSGGGLFNLKGEVVGACTGTDGTFSAYSSLDSINMILNRVGLTAVPPK